jgi:acyl carrier protein
MDTTFAETLRPFLRFAGDRPIEEDSDLRQLGLDSMQAIELLFAIEDEFGTTLADDLMTDATFQTAGSLWEALRKSQGEPVDATADPR